MPPTHTPCYSDPKRQAEALAERERYGRVRGGVHSCATGVFDLAGFMKDEAYLYFSRWRPDVPTAHILPHWNWPDRVGKVTPVYVYASGDEVELFVNGVSQGRRKREKGLWRFRFNEVIYQPGEVRAVAYRNGAKWAEETVRTAGAPARLVATPERTRLASDGEDVGYVTLKVVDKDGNLCPTAKIPVTVSVSGAGRFLAVENGDETDFTWLRDPSRRTFNGLLSALVVATPGATGKISVTFTAEGLAPATALLDATRRMCYIAWDGEDCDMSSVLGMSPRVVPCVVLIRGIRYVGTRPIPSQRRALAPNATYLSRTPHIRPECHAPGPACDLPAPPRRVALCNGPFGRMVSIVGCVGTLAHIL